jgi:hypothetical protein
MSFVSDLLARSFGSPALEVNLAAFRFVIAAAHAGLIRSLEFCWERLLAMFDTCVADWASLRHLTSLFNDLIESCQPLVDCASLMAKCLSYFSAGGIDARCLILVFAVIDSLCEQFLSAITAGGWIDVILRIAFKLLELTFDPPT